MGFGHVQGATTQVLSGASSLVITLPANPTLGNLVCFSVNAISRVVTSVKDANANIYTISPSSPSNAQNASAGSAWLAYLLSAPANASNVITATLNSSSPNEVDGWCDEFSVTGGTAVFGNDIVGSGASGTAINLPTIVPTHSGSLLYAGATVANHVASVDAPWTVAAGGLSGNGDGAGYILSASGATTLAMTQNATGQWDSIVMSFYISGAIQTLGRNITLQVLRGTQAKIQSAMPLAMGEMYFATDTGNLFFGTPGFGLGYIQIGDTTKVNETLQQIAALLEAMRRAMVVIACDGGRASERDFDPAIISAENPVLYPTSN